MNPDEQLKLQRVAEALADGEAIDWERTGSSYSSLRHKFEHLRVVQRIGEIHHAPDSVSTFDVTLKERYGRSESTDRSYPTRWGPLVIREKIGEGGCAEVFRAHDPKLQIDVALKLRYAPPQTGTTGDNGKPDAADESFLSEARRLARVRHENVLTIHGADRHDGRVGLWTDLLEGQTLERRLKKEGALGADEASLIGIDVCRALAAVHAQDLIHGDIKSSNVMRQPGGKIVLLDFGSTRKCRSQWVDSDDEELGGTPLYMAPELWRGEPSSVASDVYALGVLLFRLTTARCPVEAGSLVELGEKLARGERRSLRELRPDLPADFVQIVEKALAEKADQRYASVAEMEHDLHLSVKVPQRSAQRRWLPFAALLLAAAGTAAGASAWFWFTSLRVDATLYRQEGSAIERIAPGETMRPGDQFFLQIKGSRPMHVYVLNQDANGVPVVMFPVDGAELRNPLPARAPFRLPGIVEGRNRNWLIGNAAVKETIMVVASLHALPELEHAIEGVRRSSTARLQAPGRRAIDTLVPAPGPGHLVGDDLVETVTNLVRDREDDVWIWQVELNSHVP